jgi:nucleoside-diphosphate-sugar epimerase
LLPGPAARCPSCAPGRGLPGDLHRIALDSSLAADAIGWKPWTHLEDGLRETVAYLKGI